MTTTAEKFTPTAAEVRPRRVPKAGLTTVAVAFTLVIIAALAGPRIGDPLWTDEQRTLWYAAAPPQYGPASPLASLGRIAANRWQAPLYYLVMSAWGSLTGWDVLTLRVPSLFFGVMAAAGVYALARRYANPEIGLYAVFTMGVSAFYVNYLHDMRNYMLMVLLTVTLFWAYGYTTRKRNRAGYIALALSTAGLLYTHYFAAFAVGGVGLFHLIVRFRKPGYWHTLIAFAAGVGLFLPWTGVLLRGILVAQEHGRAEANMAPVDMVRNVLSMFANGGALLVLLLLAAAARYRGRYAGFVWFWLASSGSAILIASRFVPALTEMRYLIFLWPGLAFAAGAGIYELRKRGVPSALTLGLWCIGCGYALLNPAFQAAILPTDFHPPLDDLVVLLQGRTGPDDAVTFYMPDNSADVGSMRAMIDYYLYDANTLRNTMILSPPAILDAVYADSVREAVDDADRVWLAYERGRRNWRLGPVEGQWLPAAGYASCGIVVKSDDVTLSLSAREPDAGLTFVTEDGGTVDVYPLERPSVTPENIVASTIGWRTGEGVNAGLYSLGVHVDYAAGGYANGFDAGLIGDGFRCRADDISLPGPGDYLVRATVYNWQTGERLLADGVERPVVGAVTITD